jgi:hypothetical protein
MAGSTLDPDKPGQRRRRRKTLKGHDARALGPGDSSDSGSDVVGQAADPEVRADADIGTDRVVGPAEAGLGGGLDQAEDARRREVAENAYYRSEKRGFAPGHEERDWLEAEAEIKSRGKKRR